MATGRANGVIQHLHRVALGHDGAGLSDGQLLERFLDGRDEAAFAALVRRHGPMVWGVCRRVLGHEQDAEDAFQAAFLVLARKAGSIAARELLAGWLYGVACNTARKARAVADRRRARERQVAARDEPAAPTPDPLDDVRPLLDRVLSGLPDKYRLPVVLCDLEGKTHKEAARQLGWPVGTLSGRLVRARRRLAGRLARHGLAPAAGAGAVLLAHGGASAAVPAGLVSSAARAAGLLAAGRAPGLVADQVLTLMEGTLKAMLAAKLKAAAGVILAALMLAAGAAGVAALGRPQGPPAAAAPPGAARRSPT
jgi:RNA polymerase sigma-70 factor (ECF subfamily)